MNAQERPDERVQIHLDRLPPGRSHLPLDHLLVREDQVLQGHRVEGFETRILGELDVDTLDQKVLVHGEFTARRTMTCDRSGEPFDMDYPVGVEVVIYRTPQRGPESNYDEDDNWVFVQAGGVVDLNEALLEAVVLDEPQRVVHPDHEAAEMPVIGDETEDEDEAIDPRWEALRRLREGDGPGDGSGHD